MIPILTFWFVEIYTSIGAWAISSPGTGLCASLSERHEIPAGPFLQPVPIPLMAAGPCDAHSTAAESGKFCTISAENTTTLT